MEAKAKRGVVGQRDLLITMRGILDVAGEYIRRNLAENEQGAPLMLDLADWWYSEPHVRLTRRVASRLLQRTTAGFMLRATLTPILINNHHTSTTGQRFDVIVKLQYALVIESRQVD
ncbi:uncharacterized protein PG998_004038 [Apiospora kogelbergensis]|uniref:uncharacterized protein n=1 Tax=Apiospora kogelbergensis TaxID=1337665 RepID=UPI0031305793